MERSHRLLLATGLLAALLLAAAATIGPQCDPTFLATQAALFCASDMSTARCCEPVVAAFDLGGDVSCLCRVAAEPRLVMAGLNASHHLTIYASCGGLRPGVAHLAAACEGPAPPVAVVSSPPPLRPSHVPRRKQPTAGTCPSVNNLATAVGVNCWEQLPKRSCCMVLRAAVSDFDVATCL